MKGTQGAVTGLALGEVDLTGPKIQDTVADLVLGQGDFATRIANWPNGSVNSSGFFNPVGVAIDRSAVPNRIYVSDRYNHRVLGWANGDSLVNGAPADLVLGQPDFSSKTANNGGRSASSLYSPDRMAVDGAGNLYVADRGNSRVLEYDNPFGSCPTCDTGADRVFGQPSFTSGGCSNPAFLTASAKSLCVPFSVAVDTQGNMYVADMANDRVLEYDNPLGSCATCDAVADRVFGQPDFTTRADGLGGARGLRQPNDVAVDSMDNLYVADFKNHRVLEYDNPLGSCATCDTVADRVFGQSSLGGFIFFGTVNATSLHYPSGVAVDSVGNVYITDLASHRVLEYDTPLTTDAVADRVFGQGTSFDSAMCNFGRISASSLCFSTDVAVDGSDNLYVTDAVNQRVLRFNSGDTSPPQDEVIVPQDEVIVPTESFHFEEDTSQNCSLQNTVEFSFEKVPGDPSSGDAGHTTNDLIDSSVIAMMTFPDSFVAVAEPFHKEDESSNPHPYIFEFEVLFDCSEMTAHVSDGQSVTISVSGLLTDEHTFSGSGVITTHP